MEALGCPRAHQSLQDSRGRSVRWRTSGTIQQGLRVGSDVYPTLGSMGIVSGTTADRGPADHPAAGVRAGHSSWLEALFRETLTATFWFDSGPAGKPHPVRLRFSGRCLGISGKPRPGDRFEQEELIDCVVPGTGPFSITTRVSGVNPGEWLVTAEPVTSWDGARRLRPFGKSRHGRFRSVNPAVWRWRAQASSSGLSAQVRTGLGPLASLPGVALGAWAVLVALGMAVGFTFEAAVLGHHRLPVGQAITLSLGVTVLGIGGAKAWYAALHGRLDGWCIQGFLLAAAVGGVAALALVQAPFGTYLDAITPGLFFGLAIGRLGCFLGGCCSGRPSRSRFAIWASDRRVGTRRLPTQLLESLLCFSIGTAALALAIQRPAPATGAVFIAAVAVYTLCRQFILRLRAEPRRSQIGWVLTATAAAAVLLADLLVWATKI